MGAVKSHISHSVPNINQPQKEFIQDCFREQNHFFKECLFDLQSSVSENIGNLHLEVIRQFEIQKVTFLLFRTLLLIYS